MFLILLPYPYAIRECMYGVDIKTLLQYGKGNIRRKEEESRRKGKTEWARLPPREAYEGGAIRHQAKREERTEQKQPSTRSKKEGPL